MTQTRVHDTLVDFSRSSDAGTHSFGELIQRLIVAGVERYHADLVRSEKTFYLPSGESEVLPNAALDVAPAEQFSAAGVEAALRAIQSGKTRYKQFCLEVLAAGCVGYIVSIAGRRVVYYGKTGETYVEPFPGPR